MYFPYWTQLVFVVVMPKEGFGFFLVRHQVYNIESVKHSVKMAYLYKSDGVVAEGYANFQKLVSIAIRRLPIIRITIDTILQIFAYPCATRYADFIGFSGEPHLKPHSHKFLQYAYCTVSFDGTA